MNTFVFVSLDVFVCLTILVSHLSAPVNGGSSNLRSTHNSPLETDPIHPTTVEQSGFLFALGMARGLRGINFWNISDHNTLSRCCSITHSLFSLCAFTCIYPFPTSHDDPSHQSGVWKLMISPSRRMGNVLSHHSAISIFHYDIQKP